MAMDLDNNKMVMFPNSKKVEGDNLPDYKGEGVYEGVKFEVGLWKNVSKAGAQYLGGKLSAPFQGGAAGAGAAAQSSTASDAPPPY
jgi:uncharacterized protein (DUF736 family)